MRTHTRSVVVVILALLGLISVGAAKSREYVAPKAYHAKTYPARDAHDEEKVAIAVDPYDMPDKTAGVFVINYKSEGLLPMLLVVSNDGNQPISLAGMKVEMVTVDRTKLSPASSDDIYRRIARAPVTSDTSPTTRGPLPIPRKPKQSIKKEERNEIESAGFQAQAVEPHGSQSGFLFFDVEGIDNPLAGAHLYITGIRDSSGQELMFFDIPLEKYLTYRPGQPK